MVLQNDYQYILRSHLSQQQQLHIDLKLVVVGYMNPLYVHAAFGSFSFQNS